MHWHALCTKSRREQQVDAILRGMVVETYLPTVRRKVRRRDRPERTVYVLCYLFASIDFDTMPRPSIAWMPGIRRMVTVGNQLAIVANDVLVLTKERLASKIRLEHSRLRSADRLRITSGPLRNW